MSSGATYGADFVFGPIHPSSTYPAIGAPRAEQLIVSTGATPARQSVAMPVGAYATLKNAGGTDLYFICSNLTTAPAAHDATHPWRPLEAGREFNYIVETVTTFVWIVRMSAEDANAQANIAQSSPLTR